MMLLLAVTVIFKTKSLCSGRVEMNNKWPGYRVLSQLVEVSHYFLSNLHVVRYTTCRAIIRCENQIIVHFARSFTSCHQDFIQKTEKLNVVRGCDGVGGGDDAHGVGG